MYLTDSKGRRKRYAPSRPKVGAIKITPADIDGIFEPIHTHGPLPTTYIKEFAPHNALNALQHRLGLLYDGVCAKSHEHIFEDGKDITTTANPSHKCAPINYLVRHKHYFNPIFMLDQAVVHDINERAERCLSREGKLSPFIQRKDQLLHRFMSACITASIQLACRQKGLIYISRNQLLSEKEASSLRIALSADKKDCLEPDDLFAIEYQDGTKRAFALEVDRATEPLKERRKDSDSQQSITKKFKSYNTILTNRLFRYWGIKALIPLFVTTDMTRMRTAESLWSQLAPAFKDRMLFRAYTTFDDEWSVPPVLWEILDGWQTADGKAFDLSK